MAFANIKIKPVDNEFKVIAEIPKKLIDLELNDYLEKIDEINRLVINDKNELFIRELLNRIAKAIKHIEKHQFIFISQYEEMSNFDNHLLEILKGTDK